MRKLILPRRRIFVPRVPSRSRERGFLCLSPSVGIWGRGQYLVDSADFDGTNDFMARGSGLTGAADSKTGILSGWWRQDGGDGTLMGLFNLVTTLGGGVGRCNWTHLSDNTYVAFAANAAGTTIMRVFTASTYAASAAWHHFLASWNLATTTTHLFVDDVDDKGAGGGNIAIDDTVDYTTGDSGVGALPDSTAKFNGCLAELYFAPGQYLDFSVTENRRKFITANGKPASLGPDGILPTGTRPAVYFSLKKGEPVANFAINRGTGGDFSITGTLDTGSSSPTD